MQKLYLEDLKAGDRFVSREYELTEEKIKSFAKEYDPQPFHLDADAAEKHPIFQGLAGSGWQTAAITMRLWTECMPLAGGLVGFGGDIQWKLPTRANDRLHIEVEITDIRRSKSKPLQGVVTYLTLTKNQHDQVVQQSTTNVLVWSKEATNLPEY